MKHDALFLAVLGALCLLTIALAYHDVATQANMGASLATTAV